MVTRIVCCALLAQLLCCSSSDDSGGKKCEGVFTVLADLCGGGNADTIDGSECFTDVNIDCNETKMCLEQLFSCEIAAIEGCIDQHRTCNLDKCATVTIDCANSEYYDSTSSKWPAYDIEAALGACAVYAKPSSPPRGTTSIYAEHIRVCLGGVCLARDDVLSAICGDE